MLLERNFELYPQYFTSEALKVDHAIQNLSTWAAHPDPKLAKRTDEQNPITWAAVQLQNGVKFTTYEAFKEAIKAQFSDPKAAQYYYKEALDNYAMTKGEEVRKYEARMKALWMQAALIWDDDGDATARNTMEHALYMTAYSGMHTWIKKAIAPLVPEGVRQFATIKELFFRASCAEVLPPSIHVPESTTTTKMNTATAATTNTYQGGDKSGYKKRRRDERGARGEHTGAATTVPYNKRRRTSASSNDTRPRAPFVATEIFKARLQKGECTRCGRTGHTGYECRTYRPAVHPTKATNTPASSSIKMIEASKN